MEAFQIGKYTSKQFADYTNGVVVVNDAAVNAKDSEKKPIGLEKKQSKLNKFSAFGKNLFNKKLDTDTSIDTHTSTKYFSKFSNGIASVNLKDDTIEKAEEKIQVILDLFAKLVIKENPTPEQIQVAENNINILLNSFQKRKEIESSLKKRAKAQEIPESNNESDDAFKNLKSMDDRDLRITDEQALALDQAFLEGFHPGEIPNEDATFNVDYAKSLILNYKLNPPKTESEFVHLISSLQEQLNKLQQPGQVGVHPSLNLDQIRKDIDTDLRKIRNGFTAFIKDKYTINKAVTGNGNCLFDSVYLALNHKKKVTKEDRADAHAAYREIAAEYIRQNREQFNNDITALINDKAVTDKIDRLYAKHGGKAEYIEDFRAKHKRGPDNLDIYCDVLQEANKWKLYAGTIELKALSESLNLPIWVMGPPPNEPESQIWILTMDSAIEESETTLKSIFIYYNGYNHYQNLIPNEYETS